MVVATTQVGHPTGAAVALQEMVAALELLSPQTQGQPLQGRSFHAAHMRTAVGAGLTSIYANQINNKLRAIVAAALRTS